jgi:hypothetical protein
VIMWLCSKRVHHAQAAGPDTVTPSAALAVYQMSCSDLPLVDGWSKTWKTRHVPELLSPTDLGIGPTTAPIENSSQLNAIYQTECVAGTVTLRIPGACCSLPCVRVATAPPHVLLEVVEMCVADADWVPVRSAAVHGMRCRWWFSTHGLCGRATLATIWTADSGCGSISLWC